MPDYFTHYPQSSVDVTREEDELQVFPATVLSVDHERMVCSIRDEKTGAIYREVGVFPSNTSSLESTDVNMPEEGTTCIATNLLYSKGWVKVAIITYTLSGTQQGIDSVATRGPKGTALESRKRALYRKAYPGQKTVNTSSGYSEKVDGGWDRITADLSRDYLNTHSRVWTQMTSARVNYSDSGLTVSGPVSRPDADGIQARILPDGSKESLVLLKPDGQLTDRYQQSVQDIIPLVENRSMVQEFALDFPVPAEILHTDLLDTVLGASANPWERTGVTQTGNVSHDDQSFSIDQTWDHPDDTDTKSVGPSTGEGPTPRRRGYILERVEGTHVGYHRFDSSTYGKVLKPHLFHDRFSTDVDSGYNPVEETEDHVETRLAAAALSVRFPHEYNTTRWDVTKEGMVSFEFGATLPQENIPLSGDYEHPHGAGRSLEGHMVGSAKLVIGKNRDEEESLDLTMLGQMILRIGADDSSLPNQGRTIYTQNREQKDASQERTLQYWTSPAHGMGDAGDLENKSAFENVSLRAALDGGAIMRFGARNPKSLRKHLMNGYADGPGIHEASGSDRKDSKTSGRPTYGSGDSKYAFHDLSQAGSPKIRMVPYNWSDTPVSTGMDRHGLSIDFHTVRDVLLRIGANPDTQQSLLMDLAGGLVAWFGKDKQGRSITASLDGGVEMTIGMNNQKKALRMEFNGDVDWLIKGNWHTVVTGDIVTEAVNVIQTAKCDYITRSQNHISKAMVRHTTEAVDIGHNQGLYTSDENS